MTPPPENESAAHGAEAAWREMRTGMTGVLRGAVILLRVLWNQQARLIRWSGLMPAFRQRPWLFALIGLVLLIFVFPLGLVYVACALAASGADPRAETDFQVRPSLD